MTIPRLPSELHPPMRQGYMFAYGDGRSMSAEDAGAPRIGGRTTLVPDTVSLTLDVSRSERAIWDRFFLDTINRGKDPFLMPDPEADGWPMLTDEGAPILTDEGTPILLAETWHVLIGRSMPQRAIVGLRSRIQIELWVLPG